MRAHCTHKHFLFASALLGIALLTLVGRWGYWDGRLIDPDSIFMLRVAENVAGLRYDLTLLPPSLPTQRSVAQPSLRGGAERRRSNLRAQIASASRATLPRNDERLVDALSYYPSGRDWQREEIFLPQLGGTLFRWATSFGFPYTSRSLETFLYYFTYVLAGLTAVMAFFLARELVGAPLAWGAALFFALSPAALSRTWAGSCDKEALGGLLIFAWLAAFLRAAQPAGTWLATALWGVVAAVCYVLGQLTWGGQEFYLGVVALALALFFTCFGWQREWQVEARRLALSFLITCWGGQLIVWAITSARHAPWTPMGQVMLLAQFVAIGAVAYVAFPLLLDKIRFVPLLWKRVGLVVMLLVAAVWLYQPLVRLFNHLWHLGLLLLSPEQHVTVRFVPENTPGMWILAKKVFGAMSLLAPFTVGYLVYAAIRHKKYNYLLLAVWLVAGCIGFRWRMRLAYTLALPLPLSILLVAQVAWQRVAHSGRKMVVGRRYVLSWGAIPIVLAIAALLLQSARHTRAVARERPYTLEWSVPWREAAEWAKNHTPPDALFVSWWSYGYHLQTFGERPTIVDGGNAAPRVSGGDQNRNVDVAKLLTQPEEAFGSILAPYNPEGYPVYLFVSVKDFEKAVSINAHVNANLFVDRAYLPPAVTGINRKLLVDQIITQVGVRRYYLQEKTTDEDDILWLHREKDAQGVVHPEWSEQLLVKLLPFTTVEGVQHPATPLTYFRPVYTNGYVYIYEYLP